MDVAQSLSFAAVARARGTDPSAVSRAIRVLETQVDAPLLARTTRRMALTEAGEAFQRHAADALKAMEAARDAAQASVGEPRGRVLLTASVAFGERVLVPLLVPLKQLYPKIVMDLLLRDDTVDLMGERVDLAIRLGPALAGDLTGRKLFTTRYRVCAASSYLRAYGAPSTPQALGAGKGRHGVVSYDLPGYRDAWRFRASDGSEAEVPISPAMITSSALAVRRAALAGLGPALLADWLIGDALETGMLVDLFPDHQVTATTFETAVWLAYPPSARLSRKVRAVADVLIERLNNERVA